MVTRVKVKHVEFEYKGGLQKKTDIQRVNKIPLEFRYYIGVLLISFDGYKMFVISINFPVHIH